MWLLIVMMQRHFFCFLRGSNESFKVNDSTKVRRENGDFSRGGGGVDDCLKQRGLRAARVRMGRGRVREGRG